MKTQDDTTTRTTGRNHSMNEDEGSFPTYGLSDTGLAERFAEQHKSKVRYCCSWGTWLYFDGVKWMVDEKQEVSRLAAETVKSLYAEAELAKDSADRKKLGAFALKSESRATRRNLLRLAESQLPLPILVSELNSDPYLLNCQNGTVDLRTGELRRHSAEDLITQVCKVECAVRGSTPVLWLKFLNEIFLGDKEVIDFIQRLMGIALIGEQVEHCLPIFWGNGSNGKSVFTNTLLRLLGSYGMQAPHGFLMERRSDVHPTERADLYGKRFVLVSETKDGQQFDEGLVKSLTGGDRIRARHLYKNNFEFDPSHLFGLVTNHKPRVMGCDYGLWRRIVLVPFKATFPPEKQDKELAKKLEKEMPQILRWLVEGAVEWYQEKQLMRPKAIQESTDTYQMESDVVKEFIDDCCKVGAILEVPAQPLYDAYKAWASANGRGQLSKSRLSGSLEQKGFSKKKSSRIFYQGLELKKALDCYQQAE